MTKPALFFFIALSASNVLNAQTSVQYRVAGTVVDAVSTHAAMAGAAGMVALATLVTAAGIGARRTVDA